MKPNAAMSERHEPLGIGADANALAGCNASTNASTVASDELPAARGKSSVSIVWNPETSASNELQGARTEANDVTVCNVKTKAATEACDEPQAATVEAGILTLCNAETNNATAANEEAQGARAEATAPAVCNAETNAAIAGSDELQIVGVQCHQGEVRIEGHRFKPKPKTKVRTSKFNVLNDPTANRKEAADKLFAQNARTYPLRAVPRVQDLEEWQGQCQDLMTTLSKAPETLTLMWDDLDIDTSGTWHPTVLQMVDDAIRERLLEEGFTAEDWELDQQRSRDPKLRKRRDCGRKLAPKKRARKLQGRSQDEQVEELGEPGEPEEWNKPQRHDKDEEPDEQKAEIDEIMDLLDKEHAVQVCNWASFRA